MLILLEDAKSTEDKSAHSVSSNYSDFYTNKNTYEPTPNYGSQQVTSSTRDDDNYNRSNDYNSGEYSSGSCSDGSSSSSSDRGSSSSCD